MNLSPPGQEPPCAGTGDVLYHGLGAAERLLLYDGLFGGDLFGLYRADLAGNMLGCNVALAKLLGYARVEEIMGMPVERHYFDGPQRRKFVGDLLEKRQSGSYEVLLRHRDGRAVHVLENTVLRERSGETPVIEGVVIDITALRQSELEQRVLASNYRRLMERVRDGLVIVQGGRVVYCNVAAGELMGSGHPVGENLHGLIEEGDREKIAAFLEAIGRDGNPDPMPVVFGSGKGGGRSLLVHGSTTWHMNAPAVQLTLQDVVAGQDPESGAHAAVQGMDTPLRAEIENHKRTQEALEQNRRLARSLIDSSLDMIVAVDQKGAITEFNPAAAIKFGHEPEEVMGREVHMLYADKEEALRVQREMDRYGAYAGEVRNITREGKVFVSFLAASRVLDEKGLPLGSMGVSRDVTQAKRDQEALRESEERYRDVVDNANDLIHTVDADGRIRFTNKAWRRVFGYTEKDLEKITLYDLLVDDHKCAAAMHWMAGGSGARPGEAWNAVFRTKDGRELLCEGTSSVREENGRMVIARSIFRDITESHAAQEKIRRHNAKEKALFESSDHMFWTVDRQIRLTSYNKVYHDMIVRLHGRPPKLQKDGDGPKEPFAPKEYHDFWRAKYEEAFTGKKVHFGTSPTDTAGKRVYNEIFLSPVFNAQGEVEEVFGVGNEVTAAREAEARAREQAAKLNAIFENSADVMMWSLDRRYNITACNRSFTEKTRFLYGKKLGVGDNARDILGPVVGERLDRQWVKHCNDGFAGKRQQQEIFVRPPDGSGGAWLELFMSPISNDGRIDEVSCMAHDITEKKRTEQTILDSLREKEVLLKEVHHRVKNNLQIISSIFNLQKDHVGGDERSIALLRESQDRIRSMAFIHESLYRNKNFTQVDLAAYIGELCSNLVMSHALHGRVRMETDLQPLMLDLDKAIPCGLVLNELVSNALKHAFPGAAEGVVSVTLREEGGTVRITLEDTGRGFPAGHREGLGLELVGVLMEQMDGNLRRSTPVGGCGTAYLITFERS